MMALILTSCRDPDYRMVYSQGFSFQKYDYMVFAKPDGASTSSSLYSMDIEISNMFARYNINIVGNNDMEKFNDSQRHQTLFVRMAMVSSSKNDNLITLSFDDLVSGKTVASISARAKGDMFDPGARTKAIESVSKPIIQALERDKGILVKDGKNNK
jgi:hypothetical protein